jgi:hypothetical protein
MKAWLRGFSKEGNRKSPQTPLFQRGDKGFSPFEKGGVRGILELIAHHFNL